MSDRTQPLSSPPYEPGELLGIRDDIAPLKTMSYFSKGSIVRLYSDPIEPRFCCGPSHVSFAVHVYFQAMLTHGVTGSPAISTRIALKFSPSMKTHDRRAEWSTLPRM